MRGTFGGTFIGSLTRKTILKKRKYLAPFWELVRLLETICDIPFTRSLLSLRYRLKGNNFALLAKERLFLHQQHPLGYLCKGIKFTCQISLSL